MQVGTPWSLLQQSPGAVQASISAEQVFSLGVTQTPSLQKPAQQSTPIAQAPASARQGLSAANARTLPRGP
jgi:hypothetical protein